VRLELLKQIEVVDIRSPSFVPTVEKTLSLSRDAWSRHPVERTQGEERGRKDVYASIQSRLSSRTVRREKQWGTSAATGCGRLDTIRPPVGLYDVAQLG
jgi:hypothetical protein